MSSVNLDFLFISNNIKYLRKSRNLTQETFGKSIGIKRQDVHAIEIGIRKPRLTVLYRIAVEYDVSLDWLIIKKKE